MQLICIVEFFIFCIFVLCKLCSVTCTLMGWKSYGTKCSFVGSHSTGNLVALINFWGTIFVGILLAESLASQFQQNGFNNLDVWSIIYPIIVNSFIRTHYQNAISALIMKIFRFLHRSLNRSIRPTKYYH